MPSFDKQKLTQLASINLFKRDDTTGDFATGVFVGNLFAVNYTTAQLLIADARKQQAMGIPQGAFLLAYYEDEEDVSEALLLRVLNPAELPTDNDVVRSLIECYKDNLRTSGSKTQLDDFTRFEYSFSGVECRILGTFYRKLSGETVFGADVENFYSAHHYRVIKPHPQELEYIVNFRENEIAGGPTDICIGKVRYSSSVRFQQHIKQDVPVYVNPRDFLGKRTALFGMTRTGKSNTVKKIIQAVVSMSQKAPHQLSNYAQSSQADANATANSQTPPTPDEVLNPLTRTGVPKFPAGQLIFDINGEYANANMQDDGTAIFEQYSDSVIRYSVMEKPGFKIMKINFYQDLTAGMDLISEHLATSPNDYLNNFTAIDFNPPPKDENSSNNTRYQRKVAAYQCCLYKAGFKQPKGFKIKFPGNSQLNKLVTEDESIKPDQGLKPDEAVSWFEAVYDEMGEKDGFFDNYRKKHGHDWADEDLKALLVVLTRKKKPGGNPNISGFHKLKPLLKLHTSTVDKPFYLEIAEELRHGKIAIIDLSQGDPEIQSLYSERICRYVFNDAMQRFIANQPNNFIQFYFEEAHNLFPKKEDKDLSQIYNRLAKEGAKLNLGLTYATQEVSSISNNILKNTQNWFIAHLNNEDETKEIRKYYDFRDFSDSLIRFSAVSDKGYVRMKTYSNPFVVPVQVERFMVDKSAGLTSHQPQTTSKDTDKK